MPTADEFLAQYQPQQAQASLPSADDFLAKYSPQKPAAPPSPVDNDFMSRVRGDVMNRANEGADALVAYKNNEQGLGQTGLQLLGKMGGGTTADIIGEGMKSVGSLLPDAIKNAPQNIANYLDTTKVGQAAGNTGLAATNAYNDFAQNNPNAARSIESVGDIANATGGLNMVAGLANGAGDIASTMGNKSGVSPAIATAGLSTIPGGIEARFKGAFDTMSPEEIDNAVDAAHDKSNGLFKQVANSGVGFTPQSTGNIINGIYSDLAGKRIDPAKALSQRDYGSTLAALDDMSADAQAGKLGLPELFGYRASLGDIAGRTSEGKPTPDAFAAKAAKSSLDDQIASLQPTDFTGQNGLDTVDIGKQAIAEWGKYRSLDTIGDILKKANGDPNAIKAGFAKLLNNDKKMSGFTDPDEIAAFQRASERGPGEVLERAMGTFGFDPAGKLKNMALPGLMSGGALMAPAEAIPAVVAGTILRQTGKYAGRGYGQKAFDAVNDRDTTPTPAPAPISSNTTPPPAPILALPAPKVTIWGNSAGQALSLTPAAKESLGSSPSTAAEQRSGAAIQAQNLLREKTGNAYDEIQKISDAKKSADMQRFMSDNKEPIQNLINDTVEKYKDAGIQPGTLGEALMNILKDQSGSLNLQRVGELLNGLASGKIPGLIAAGALAASPTQAGQPPPQNPQATQTQTIAAPIQPMSYTTEKPGGETEMQAAFKKAGVESPLMESFRKAESNGNDNAKNPNSSASGPFQFTLPTWAGMVKKYGAQTGIGLQDINKPEAQSVMARLLAQDNIKSLQNNLGRMPTKGELYQAHVLGSDGASRLIRAQGSGRPAFMLFPRAVTTANNSIFFAPNGQPRTVEQVYSLLGNKV